MLKTNARNIQAYYPTCASVCAQHSHVMEVEKDPKPFSKISRKLEHGL